jgi:hypothetical protein
MRSIHTTAFTATPIIGLGLIALSSGLTTGCDEISKALGVSMPSIELNQVDLVDAPSASQALSWSCFEFIGVCPGMSKPSEEAMNFSFDVVFDMTNNNRSLPIPLVEILLGISVFEEEDLGAMCISFCDPDEEDCAPERDAEGACDVESADVVDSASDLVPNESDLADLATGSSSDDTENGEFRVIPAGDTIEAHIQFDLDGETAMNIGERAVVEAVSSALSSGKFKLKVPYEVEGNLFFDVPKKGRYVVGFGPFESSWTL